MRNLVDANSLRRLLFAKMDRSRMQLTISAELFDDLIKMVPQMTDDMAFAELEDENERLNKAIDTESLALQRIINEQGAELAALKEQFKMLRMFGSNAKYNEWAARDEPPQEQEDHCGDA